MGEEKREDAFNKAIKRTLQEREAIKKEKNRVCREIDMRKKQVISELEKDASERQTDLKELQEKVKASAAGDYETVKLLMKQMTHI